MPIAARCKRCANLCYPVNQHVMRARSTSWIEPSASASPPRTPLCALGGESGHMPTESKLSSLQGTSTCLVFSACAKPDVGQPQGNRSFSASPILPADIHRQGSSLRPHGFTEGQAEMPITTIKRARERDNEQG